MLGYRTRELRKAGGSLLSMGYALPLAPLIVLAQIINAVWIAAAWVYLAALLVLVVGIFGLFPRLLAEIWSPKAA